MVLRELHTLEETTMDKVRFLMSDTGAPFTAACREALEQKGVDVTVVEKDGIILKYFFMPLRSSSGISASFSSFSSSFSALSFLHININF